MIIIKNRKKKNNQYIIKYGGKEREDKQKDKSKKEPSNTLFIEQTKRGKNI